MKKKPIGRNREQFKNAPIFKELASSGGSNLSAKSLILTQHVVPRNPLHGDGMKDPAVQAQSLKSSFQRLIKRHRKKQPFFKIKHRGQGGTQIKFQYFALTGVKVVVKTQ